MNRIFESVFDSTQSPFEEIPLDDWNDIMSSVSTMLNAFTTSSAPRSSGDLNGSGGLGGSIAVSLLSHMLIPWKMYQLRLMLSNTNNWIENSTKGVVAR